MSERSPYPALLFSVRWSNIMLFALVLYTGAVLFYMGYYFWTVSSTAARLRDFLIFREQVLLMIPFLILVLLFFMSIWIHAWYSDLHNLFEKFELNPFQAMLWVLLPLLNFVGIGIVFSRVINYLDREIRDPQYEDFAFSLKVYLTVFYGALFSLILAGIMAFTLPQATENFRKPWMIAFTSMFFLFILAMAFGLISLILTSKRLVSYRSNIMAMEDN